MIWSIRGATGTHTSRVEKVEIKNSHLSEQIAKVDERVTTLDGRVTRLEDKIDLRFEKLEEKIDDRFEKIDDELKVQREKTNENIRYIDNRFSEIQLFLVDLKQTIINKKSQE